MKKSFINTTNFNFGFTLAELLIALAIATFTIPKILGNQENTQRKAVFKESIAMLVNACYNEAYLNAHPNVQTVTGALNWTSFVSENINYLRRCNTCHPTIGGWGFYIQNGAYVGSASGTADLDTINFDIDWNGAAGPNTFATNVNTDDIVRINMCLNKNGTGCTGNSTKACTVAPVVILSDGPLFNDIFSN